MTEQQTFWYIFFFLGECPHLQFILTSTSLWVDPPPAWWTYAPRWSALYLFCKLVGVSRSMGIALLPCSTSRWNCLRCACTSLKLPLCVHVCENVTLFQLVKNTVKVRVTLCKCGNQGTMTVKEVSSLSEGGVWAWDDTKLRMAQHKGHHNDTCQYTSYAPGQA